MYREARPSEHLDLTASPSPIEGPWPSAKQATVVNLGLWTAVALWTVTMVWASARASGTPVPWEQIFWFYGVGWLTWPLATWGLYGLARRFPLETEKRGAAVVRVVALGLLWTAAQTLFLAYLESLPRSDTGWWDRVLGRLQLWAYIDLLIFGCVAVAVYGLSYFLRYQQQVQAARRLRQHITQAELSALHSQLHPHFLFNALNSVSNLIRVGQRDQSLATLARLSDLLRDVLGTRGTTWRTLQDELDFVEHYMAIQRVRFGNRLSWHQQVDASCLDVAVPSLLLQPLVENAVQHGVAPRPEPSTVELHVKCGEGDELLLDLSNPLSIDVPQPAVAPPADGTQPGHGLGLDNLRARLALLYPRHDANDLLRCRTRRTPTSEGDPMDHRWHVQIRLPPPPSDALGNGSPSRAG